MKKRRERTGLSSISSLALFLIFSVFILSCGESGLMDIYAVSSALRLSTIPAGSVLEAGDHIPVSLALDSGSAPPASLRVNIYRNASSAVSTRDYEVDSSVVLVETDNLSPGYYILSAVSQDAENPETELELPFFISSTAGSIQRISAYPSTVLPGEGMVLFADLASAPADDPYLRWKAGGRIISSGRVAEGAQLANWQVPETPGIYPVTAEYFPFPPPDNADFSFPGIEKRIEAFVSTEQRTPRGELGPADSYSSLFHFRGTYESNGYASLPKARIQGSPVLALEDEIFGYSFQDGDALVFDTSLIPGRNGKEEAFVLEMKGIFSKGTVFSVQDKQSTRIVSLRRTDEGFVLSGQDFQTFLPLAMNYNVSGTNSPLYLAIAVEPGLASGQIRWYVDGEYQASAEYPGIQGLSNTGVSTIIGGDFLGLLDEFGIRKLEPVQDGGIFGFAMRERYGRSLIMAEGFDIPWSEKLLLEGSSGITKDAEESVLILEQSGRAGFAVPVQGTAGRVVLSFNNASAKAGLRFRLGKDESNVRTLVPAVDGSLVLRIVHRERKVHIHHGETILASFTVDNGGDEVQLWLEAESGSLGLDSILVTRGEDRLSSQAVETGVPPEV